MTTLKERAQHFLAQKRIAVAGVSRTKQDAANLVYRKLRDTGHTVFAINPNAAEIDGASCYPDLKSVPDGVDAVVIVTRPEVTEQIVRECADLGVRQVWMHRAFGTGSVSAAAVAYCEEHDIAVIPGSCPMMFCDPVDFPHRCMRWVLGLTGGLPR